MPKVEKKPQQDVFPFLELAGELRNRIYSFSADGDKIYLGEPFPTILQLNRQIQRETSGILFPSKEVIIKTSPTAPTQSLQVTMESFATPFWASIQHLTIEISIPYGQPGKPLGHQRIWPPPINKGPEWPVTLKPILSSKPPLQTLETLKFVVRDHARSHEDTWFHSWDLDIQPAMRLCFDFFDSPNPIKVEGDFNETEWAEVETSVKEQRKMPPPNYDFITEHDKKWMKRKRRQDRKRRQREMELEAGRCEANWAKRPRH